MFWTVCCINYFQCGVSFRRRSKKPKNEGIRLGPQKIYTLFVASDEFPANTESGAGEKHSGEYVNGGLLSITIFKSIVGTRFVSSTVIGSAVRRQYKFDYPETVITISHSSTKNK